MSMNSSFPIRDAHWGQKIPWSVFLCLFSLAVLFPLEVIAADEDRSVPTTGAVEICEFECSNTNGLPYRGVGIRTGQDLRPRKLTISTLPESWPVLSPNGVDVAFFRAGSIGWRSTGGTLPRKWDVYLVTQQGTNERRVTNMEFYDCCGLDISPDGSNIIFSVMNNEYPKDSHFELRLVSAAGIANGEKRYIGGQVLLRNDKQNMMPLFSRDGRSVLFIAKERRDGTLKEMFKLPFHGSVFFRWELCVLDIETKKLKVLDESNAPIEGLRLLQDTGEVTYTKSGQTVRLRP